MSSSHPKEPFELISTLVLYLGRDFSLAIRLYTAAIAKNPQDPTIWCNRAYARMLIEEFGYALDDTSMNFLVLCGPDGMKFTKDIFI